MIRSSHQKPAPVRALRRSLVWWFPLGVALCVALTPGCQAQDAAVEAPRAATDDATAGPAARPGTERSRTVTLTMSLTVDDVGASVDRLRAYADAHDGYVESAEVSASNDGYATVRLRLPAAQMSATRDELRSLGEVTSEQETVEDVTAQRADLGARLRNARAQETRLLALLTDEAATLADVLSIESELSRVRERVERLEAQHRVLEGDIAQAHYTVTLSPRSASYWTEPGAAIAGAAARGTEAAWAVAVTGAVVLAAAAPTLLMLAFALWIFYRVVRFAFRRRAKVAPAA